MFLSYVRGSRQHLYCIFQSLLKYYRNSLKISFQTISNVTLFVSMKSPFDFSQSPEKQRNQWHIRSWRHNDTRRLHFLCGGPNDVFILKTTGTLSIASGKKVLSDCGAKAEYIFCRSQSLSLQPHMQTWRVSFWACFTSVSFMTRSSLNGSSYAWTSVTLRQATIAQPGSQSCAQEHHASNSQDVQHKTLFLLKIASITILILIGSALILILKNLAVDVYRGRTCNNAAPMHLPPMKQGETGSRKSYGLALVHCREPRQ